MAKYPKISTLVFDGNEKEGDEYDVVLVTACHSIPIREAENEFVTDMVRRQMVRDIAAEVCRVDGAFKESEKSDGFEVVRTMRLLILKPKKK